VKNEATAKKTEKKNRSDGKTRSSPRIDREDPSRVESPTSGVAVEPGRSASRYRRSTRFFLSFSFSFAEARDRSLYRYNDVASRVTATRTATTATEKVTCASSGSSRTNSLRASATGP